MKRKKQIIGLIVISILLITLGLFIINKIIENKNKDYCLSYNFSNCPEDKCFNSSCYELKSTCCPKGLLD